MGAREAKLNYIPQSSIWHQASWNCYSWTFSLEITGRLIIESYPRIALKAINCPTVNDRLNSLKRKETLGFSEVIIDTKDIAWVLDKIKWDWKTFKCTDTRLSRKISSRKK